MKGNQKQQQEHSIIHFVHRGLHSPLTNPYLPKYSGTDVGVQLMDIRNGWFTPVWMIGGCHVVHL